MTLGEMFDATVARVEQRLEGIVVTLAQITQKLNSVILRLDNIAGDTALLKAKIEQLQGGGSGGPQLVTQAQLDELHVLASKIADRAQVIDESVPAESGGDPGGEPPVEP